MLTVRQLKNMKFIWRWWNLQRSLKSSSNCTNWWPQKLTGPLWLFFKNNCYLYLKHHCVFSLILIFLTFFMVNIRRQMSVLTLKHYLNKHTFTQMPREPKIICFLFRFPGKEPQANTAQDIVTALSLSYRSSAAFKSGTERDVSRRPGRKKALFNPSAGPRLSGEGHTDPGPEIGP